MSKICHIFLVLCCLSASITLRAQCSVTISTNTTQLNCTNTSITLTANAEGPLPVTYLWSTTATGNSIVVTDSGTYEVTITSDTTCTTKTKIIITKDISKPIVSIRAFPENICAGESATLVALGAQSYVWQPPINPSSDVVTVSPSTTTTYTVTGTAINGCTASKDFELVVNQLPAATIAGTTSVCKNAAQPAITFTGVSGAKPFTFSYTINNGPVQTVQTTGQNASVSVSAPTGALGELSYNLVSVMDVNGCLNQQTDTATISVLPEPELTSSKVASVCSNALFQYNAVSSANPTTFGWTRPAVNGISNAAESGSTNFISETLNNTTLQPVVVSYIFTLSTGTGCVITDSLKVTVNPTPVIEDISDTTFCNAFFVSTGIPFSSSSPGTSFRWINSNTRIGLPARGTGNIPPFNATNSGNSNISATITVFIKASADSCNGQSMTFTITVRPAPVFTGLKASTTCNDSLFTYTATSSVANTSFSWIREAVQGISNPKGSGSSAVISETLLNTTDTPVVVSYIFALTAQGSSCTTTETFEVTVNPSPVIDFVGNKSYCNGEFVSGGIRFTSTSPNAVFSWINNNPNIGLSASGDGDILPFNATNFSADPIEATITVFIKASADNCGGASSTFKITILPGPVLTSSKLLSICTDTIFNYTASSPASGTLYSWKRLELPTGVTGETLPDIVNLPLIKDILHNNNNEAATVNYEINLSIVGNTGCKSVDTIDVLVFPTPKINLIRDTLFCNSTSVTGGIPFSSNTSSAVFKWTNTNTNIGLSAGGTGAITPFIVTNRTTDTIGSTVKVSVTVNNGQCPGPDESFRIIVYPTPSMISAKSSSFCNDSLFQFTATSSAMNTSFKWNRPKVDNIIPETGNGNTAEISETLQNGTSNPIVVKYLFTMETGQLAVLDNRTGCTMNDSLLVTVNPTPVIVTIRDTVFCNKTPVTNGISFNSPTPNKVFTWSNSNTSIGLPATGTGNIPSFIATNTDTVPITATITVNIKASSDSCIGASKTFNITVNPSAARPNFYSLSGTADSTELQLCNGSDNINFNILSAAPRTSYLWSLVSGNSLNVAIRDQNDPNTVISFGGSGEYRIGTVATNFGHGSCKDTVTQKVTVKDRSAFQERKVFLKQPGNLLIYPDNLLSKYQWGTNRVLSVSPDSSFGPPIILRNEVYQFYPAGENLDVTNYLYWVLLEDASGCKSRVYYNGPYAARQSQVVYVNQPVELVVFPNPNKGNFDVSLKGNIYGNILAKIYNTLGQQVFTKKFVKTAPEVYERFNAGKLISGIYFLELNSSDLKKVVSRFIIQH